MDQTDTDDIPAEPPQRPWIVLADTYDVEAWIANYNRSLQAAIVNPKLQGYGICFTLDEGGEIFLHTGGEGDIALDVTPEAAWVAPLLTAATGYPAPAGQIWHLPSEVLSQLVFSHDFRIKKF
jgi:hypothetical protein